MSDSLYPMWTTDEKHVYCRGVRIRADRTTFRMLNDVFARDATTVFCCNGPLRDVDAASFEIVGAYFEADGSGGGMHHSYGKDRSGVFFHSGMGKPRLLKSADPASFRWLGTDYGADAKHVYLAGYLVEKAEPATFRHFKGPYAADAARCFYGTKWIRNLDPATFSVVEYEGQIQVEFARDAKRVVFRDLELEGADPATLTVRHVKGLTLPEVSDRNRSWSNAELWALLNRNLIVHEYPAVLIEGMPSGRKFAEDGLHGMELQIITFCAVVHHRNAEKAAKLGRQVYTPATIRRHIEELQAKVGVRLAEMDDERIRITPDGLALHRQLGAPVDFVAVVLDAIRDPSGR